MVYTNVGQFSNLFIYLFISIFIYLFIFILGWKNPS
jgi:hypothetical protein